MEKEKELLSGKHSPITKKRPIKVLQFGEGNFLRAFVDWIIQELNNQTTFYGDVKIIQPIPTGAAEKINQQNGLYHVLLKGYSGGNFRASTHLIDVVKEAINPYSRFEDFLAEAENEDLEFIVSNTTEAGIAYQEDDQLTDRPASSFPGKLLQFLYHRYQTLPNSKSIYILPCELIENNGQQLKKIIYQLSEKWSLGSYFNNWLAEKIIFCNTLVDRIVTGFPSKNTQKTWEEHNQKDELLVEGELFHLWVIEGPDSLKNRLLFDQTPLNIILTNNLKRYRERKVRILNGLHTLMVPVAYLSGIRTVRESTENQVMFEYLSEALHLEMLPTLTGDQNELKEYAEEIIWRFKNPAIHHELISIALNSFSKYKTRVLPSVLALYQIEEKLAKHLLFSLAALICFYRGEWENETIELRDDSYVLKKLDALWREKQPTEIVHEILTDTKLWERDLTEIPGLSECVNANINDILSSGVMKSLGKLKVIE
ncbi:MAG: tagaturonate reductase [Bacteroidota bacterium]